MANGDFPFLHAGVFRRLATTGITIVCILCTLPQEGIALALNAEKSSTLSAEVVHLITTGNEVQLVERFDELERNIEVASDRLEEGRRFLISFIQQVNAQYGTNLTIKDACVLVKQNMHMFQIPAEAQSLLLATIDLFESDAIALNVREENVIKKGTEIRKNGLSWPWEWNWWGLNKKKKQTDISSIGKVAKENPYGPNEEIPGSIYAGGVEIFAGCLACILASVFPLAGGFGLGLIGDGIRRILNGSDELDKQRKGYPDLPTGRGNF